MGYSHIQISNIERGVIEPSRELIKKLTQVYGITWEFLYGGGPTKEKEFIARIEVTQKEKKMIEQTEGEQWVENFVPIPIAKDSVAGGPPRIVREDPDGVAIIYKDWVKNRENFTAVWMVGDSMEKTIPNGSLIGIDHSKKEIFELDGQIVAIRKESEATIKRLRVISKSLVLGLPDNPDYMKEATILEGEQIDNAIIGKVAWWWGKQD